MLTRETFRGPWAGLPVAWTAGDEFDEEAYRRDVVRTCQSGAPGVYTGGTTGEFYAMEFDEFQAVTRATVEECRHSGTPTMIGCSSTYTLGAQRRAAFAAEAGADAMQLTIPYWMALDAAAVEQFFVDVSRAADGLALSVYETTRCKVTLTLDQHRGLKDRIPNYLMVKSNEGTLGANPEGCRQLSEIVNVFTGESLWEQLGPHGVAGGCSSVVYWNPRVCLALWDAVERQDWDAVKAQSEPLARLVDFLIKEFGSRGYTDTAYDRLGGLASGFLSTSARSRAPYVSVSEDDIAELRSWCEREFPAMLDF